MSGGVRGDARKRDVERHLAQAEADLATTVDQYNAACSYAEVAHQQAGALGARVAALRVELSLEPVESAWQPPDWENDPSVDPARRFP